jgi:hypothetical protein
VRPKVTGAAPPRPREGRMGLGAKGSMPASLASFDGGLRSVSEGECGAFFLGGAAMVGI